MTKKGELSLNIVVVAALAMIVLVILSVLVFQGGGNIQEGMRCENLAQGGGGTCISADYTCEGYFPDQNYAKFSAGRCDTGEICCIEQ